MEEVYHALPKDIAVVLHNVRSAENVGAIFRTADAAGATRIILSGYTPTPIDRFGRARNDIAKSALGAEKWLPWKKTETLRQAIRTLHEERYRVFAIEQSSDARTYRTIIPSMKRIPRAAFVFGNEVKGLTKRELSLVHDVLEIPMRGKKESLNVSAACAIALFVLLER